MRATLGDDRSVWRECRSLFPCGTPFGVEDLSNLARPPRGQVTADLLRRLGMNADLAESDRGTVVQRRARQEPVEQGGWGVFHTYSSSLAYLNPAVSSLVTGAGRSGWFGWYESPRMQELVQA
jgi:peptide/nickel transport system substrate-binding protein